MYEIRNVSVFYFEQSGFFDFFFTFYMITLLCLILFFVHSVRICRALFSHISITEIQLQRPVSAVSPVSTVSAVSVVFAVSAVSAVSAVFLRTPDLSRTLLEILVPIEEIVDSKQEIQGSILEIG